MNASQATSSHVKRSQLQTQQILKATETTIEVKEISDSIP
jgi:hypothetical protein